VKCDFCGKDIPMGTGMIYVYKDGKTLYFCSTKCKKNALVLKRDNKLLKWTDSYTKGEKSKKAKKKTKKKAKKKKRVKKR